MAFFALTGYAQEPDTVVTIPGGGGFSEFYEKYSGVLWTVLGLLGVTAFLTYRTAKVRAALDEVIKAAQDGHVSESEFQAIVRAVKAIWGKKE